MTQVKPLIKKSTLAKVQEFVEKPRKRGSRKGAKAQRTQRRRK